ncbi:trypsin-3-like [Chironomus tepperi]|uniref:trypsin-3-like n=1 Tax=Chironomus tepperi TaxID=113505 RepID=UPI00391F32D5
MRINNKTDSTRSINSVPKSGTDSSESNQALIESQTTGSNVSQTQPKEPFYRRHSKLLICILAVIVIVAVILILVIVALEYFPILIIPFLKSDIQKSISTPPKNNIENSIVVVNATTNDKSFNVRLVYGNDSYGCTGTILADNAIVTSAHCVIDELDELVEIHLGGTSANNYKDIIRIPRKDFDITVHPEYEFENLENIADLAVIKLKEKLTFSSAIQPIGLPIDELKLPHVFRMNVWESNITFNMDKTDRRVTLYNSEKCHYIYMTKGGERDLKFYKNDTKEQIIFCADPKGYVPQGNSGTAVFVRKGNKTIAYGLLSFGGSPKVQLPIVLVDLRIHIDWIRNII